MTAGMLPGVEAGADLTDDGLHRYKLWRVWDPEAPRLVVCMLNPSTADEPYWADHAEYRGRP